MKTTAPRRGRDFRSERLMAPVDFPVEKKAARFRPMSTHDPLRETQQFEAMRDALREAVTAGTGSQAAGGRPQRRRRPPSRLLRRSGS